MNTLTGEQLALRLFAVTYTIQKGICPTFGQIAEARGVTESAVIRELSRMNVRDRPPVSA